MMNIDKTDSFEQDLIPVKAENPSEEQKLFSKREVEILQLMAEGCTSKQIAEKLFLSEHTIIAHRKNMQQKTGFSNSIALVYFAAKNDII